VQLKEDFKGKVTEKEYTAYLKEKVAKYAVPRSVVFLDEMPLTEVFKVNKKMLNPSGICWLCTHPTKHEYCATVHLDLSGL
jgi:long-chain acyl-CoA synthetase